MIIVQGHVETEWESGRRSTPTMPAWHQRSSIDVLQVDKKVRKGLWRLSRYRAVPRKYTP